MTAVSEIELAVGNLDSIFVSVASATCASINALMKKKSVLIASIAREDINERYLSG